MRHVVYVLIAVLLLGCGKRGGYFADDGPPRMSPERAAQVPDAIPRDEPLSATGNDPYRVYGIMYRPLKRADGHFERGQASWYGKMFHGRRTSSGEIYDMYAMTAAHKTLPLPTYVRVTNKANNKSVVVKVNDRGPFLHGRIIDLSYAAAAKLDMVKNGTADVEVRVVTAADTARVAAPIRDAVPQPQTREYVAASGGAPVSDAFIRDESPSDAEVERQRWVFDETAQLDQAQSEITVESESLIEEETSNENLDPQESSQPPVDGVTFQVGAFADENNARITRDRIREASIGEVNILSFTAADGRVLHRVRVGPVSGQQSDWVRQRLEREGYVANPVKD